MQTTFFDMLPSASSQLGTVFAKAIDIAEAFHSKGVCLVDVKADNFMFASGSSKSDWASRLRLLDLAAVSTFGDMMTSRHTVDSGIAGLLGTPLYASLHVHNLHTPSRRDDLFALGLIFCEAIIRAQALVDGTARQYMKSAFPSFLPWANEKSDEAIGNIKEQCVLNKNSELYQRMPAVAAKKMYDFLQKTHDLAFIQAPDYAALRKLVKDIKVTSRGVAASSSSSPVTKSPARRASPRATPPRAATKARLGSATKPLEVDDDDEPSKPPAKSRAKKTAVAKSSPKPPAKAPLKKVAPSPKPVRTSSRPTRAAAMQKRDRDDSNDLSPSSKVLKTGSDSDEEMVSVDSKNSDGSDPEPMDIDTKPAAYDTAGLKLRMLLGTQVGNEYVVTKGSKQPVVVGSKPTNRSGGCIEIKGDGDVLASHIKLQPFFRKGDSCGFLVTNLGSGNTAVNKVSLDRKKTAALFRGQTLVVGETVFTLDNWNGEMDENLSILNE